MKYMSSMGGVIRGSDGRFILGFSSDIDEENVDIVELKAVIKILELLISIKPKLVRLNSNNELNILVEMDSLCLVRDINLFMKGGTVLKTGYLELYKTISSLLGQVDNFEVRYIAREGNSVADHMSRLGHTDLQYRLYKKEPPSLLQILYKDEIGSAKYEARARDEYRNMRRLEDDTYPYEYCGPVGGNILNLGEALVWEKTNNEKDQKKSKEKTREADAEETKSLVIKEDRVAEFKDMKMIFKQRNSK